MLISWGVRFYFEKQRIFCWSKLNYRTEISEYFFSSFAAKLKFHPLGSLQGNVYEYVVIQEAYLRTLYWHHVGFTSSGWQSTRHGSVRIADHDDTYLARYWTAATRLHEHSHLTIGPVYWLCKLVNLLRMFLVALLQQLLWPGRLQSLTNLWL